MNNVRFNITNEDISLTNSFFETIIHSKTITHLQLSNCISNFTSGNFISNICCKDYNGRKNDIIKYLDLSDNALMNIDLPIVKLFGSSLANINMSNNEFTQFAMEVILKHLYGKQNLKVINMEECCQYMPDSYLCKMIASNALLTTLNLSSNQLYALDIASVTHAKLRELNLSNNLFNQEIGSVAKFLENNSSLKELDLSCNHIEDENLSKILSAMKKNTTLTTLKIKGNIDVTNSLITTFKDLTRTHASFKNIEAYSTIFVQPSRVSAINVPTMNTCEYNEKIVVRRRTMKVSRWSDNETKTLIEILEKLNLDKFNVNQHMSKIIAQELYEKCPLDNNGKARTHNAIIARCHSYRNKVRK